MIVDSSALVAIMLSEPIADAMAVALRRAAKPAISATTYVESCIVMIRRHGSAAAEQVDALIAGFGVAVESVTVEHAVLARDAFLRYGKGRHPAGLNFGDCFSYALARQRDEPLLFVGADFTRTDVRVA